MTNNAVYMQKIEQIDRFSFMIIWTDGMISRFRLSVLQAFCPCIKCRGKGEKKKFDSQVMAKRIFSIGTYAIGIEFTSGCSKGIYSYSLLRKIGGAS
ncbi:MAG: hypothetical protein Tsb0015_14270 [Simkaniaceae bacterium]